MTTKQAPSPAMQPDGKTKNLSTLSANSNAITWFEIPVKDMARAKDFYETILDIELTEVKGEKENEQMALFPRLKEGSMGRTDMVSGSLIRSDRLHPAGDGLMVYLNANPSIEAVIDRIEPAGGRIILPKTKNAAGWVSILMDTEGNKIGIFAGG